MSADEPLFLDIDDVLDIHSAQLEVHGGGDGLRDRGLLESALAQPSAAFPGEGAAPPPLGDVLHPWQLVIDVARLRAFA